MADEEKHGFCAECFQHGVAVERERVGSFFSYVKSRTVMDPKWSSIDVVEMFDQWTRDHDLLIRSHEGAVQ